MFWDQNNETIVNLVNKTRWAERIVSSLFVAQESDLSKLLRNGFCFQNKNERDRVETKEKSKFFILNFEK